jgi:hypothetical protein
MPNIIALYILPKAKFTIFHTLFIYFLYFFVQYIYSYIHSPRVHSCFRIALRIAEPGFELGPAVQQADALLSELRRTLSELRRTLFFLFFFFFLFRVSQG